MGRRKADEPPKPLKDRLAGVNRRDALEVLRSELADEIETARAAGRATSPLWAQMRLLLTEIARLAPAAPTPPAPTPTPEGDELDEITRKRQNRLTGADPAARAPRRRRGQ